MSDFKQGDVVQLKGGGGRYTVESQVGSTVKVSWFNDAGNRQCQELQASDLEPYEQPIATSGPDGETEAAAMDAPPEQESLDEPGPSAGGGVDTGETPEEIQAALDDAAKDAAEESKLDREVVEPRDDNV